MSREGGGIGGNHAVTFANNNWPEFADMMGGWAGAHHIEKQMIKVDDPNSPLTKSFGSASFEHTDEFYQFPPYSPYSREKQHILLSIDVEKSDRATDGRFCTECTRPDQDYGLAWIRTYGKGRTYFTPLGHTDDHVHRSALDAAPAGGDPVHPRRSRCRRDAQRKGEAGDERKVMRLTIGLALATAVTPSSPLHPNRRGSTGATISDCITERTREAIASWIFRMPASGAAALRCQRFRPRGRSNWRAAIARRAFRRRSTTFENAPAG